ncbi:orotate phosphoribosyltransferase [candidate division KSB1 bacterium]
MDEIQQYRQKLFKLLVERSLSFGHFVLTSGKTSDYYFDCKKVTRNSEGKFLIGNVFFHEILKLDPEINGIGGLTMGADPICDAVSIVSYMKKHPIETIIVRKEPKTHGIKKDIEGNIEDISKVIVIDDVITTGGSTLKAIDVISNYENVQIVGVMILVDREEGGKENIEKRGFKVISLFKKSELIDFAKSIKS